MVVYLLRLTLVHHLTETYRILIDEVKLLLDFSCIRGMIFSQIFLLVAALLVMSEAHLPAVNDLLTDSLEEIGPESILKPAATKHLTSLSEANGYLYYSFYSGNTCNGTLEYTTGITSETCMSYQYYSPPDHYYYSFLSSLEFNSFQVKGLSDGCDGTFIAYYNDLNCQNLNYTATISSLGGGMCKKYKNETYTNLSSFQLSCKVTSTIPAPLSTYVVSSYNQSDCNGMAYTFNAYNSGSCYGVYSSNNSYSYQCDGSGTSASVLKDDYYGSLTCKASSSAMTINGGCTNAQFVSHPVPVAAVSTLVDCYFSSTSSSSTKFTEGQVAGIAMALVFALAVVVFFAGFFISGRLFRGRAQTVFKPTGDSGSNSARSSEMSATVSPSMAGRYTSTVEEYTNPMQK